MDAFFNWLSSNPPATMTLIVSFGVLVTLIILIYLVAFFRGQDISFWPPRIGAATKDQPPLADNREQDTPPASQPKSIFQIFSKNRFKQAEKQKVIDEVYRLKSLLVYIYNLHKTRYKLNYWRITYTIDTQGGVHTKEEMAIAPIEGKVYFRQIKLGFTQAAINQNLVIQNLRAINRKSNQRLEIIEISSSPIQKEYAIVLDPPATSDKPVEIIVESYRPEIFSPLITGLTGQGKLQVAGVDSSKLEVKFIAPPEIKLLSFSMSPDIGSYSIEETGNFSSLVWQGVNLPPGAYSYVIQAGKRSASN